MHTQSLLLPYPIGRLQLPNRVVMAPLTRCRSTREHVPTPMMIEYYKQRASAGLIITEATCISPIAFGYIYTPGIYTNEQINGWQTITSAVHQAGGRMFMQLWHVGRVSHPDLIEGRTPVSASAIRLEGKRTTYDGAKDYVTSHPLSIEEIKQTVQHYAQAAINALQAGCDGVEIHGANSYLIEQFIAESSNHRTDIYGGSVENRCRFALEVVDAVVKAVGSWQTGIRLSPAYIANGITHANPDLTYRYLLAELEKRQLAYVHLEEPFVPHDQLPPHYIKHVAKHFRPYYKGTLISNAGYDGTTGNSAIADGTADLIAYGKWFISNPDLVERFEAQAPLAPFDRTTFYTQTEVGYTDYKRMS